MLNVKQNGLRPIRNTKCNKQRRTKISQNILYRYSMYVIKQDRVDLKNTLVFLSLSYFYYFRFSFNFLKNIKDRHN